ncbi:exodeoxyribonuclease VII small subunit [Siccirubricoccus phaeus]|uniref:exodeoxyribonuclease VII small subunit n=1 Tax=Siccirubricoccus phaeus TaxID=2595053 RepID=UPI0011F3B5FF|nr:exodeoxyribonuclease VII small subunit [Siccirubricoccus phaeus]
MGEAETRPAAGDIEAKSFEDALAELEEIVKALEGGKGSLAEAIESYARGDALRRHCERRLAEAEAKLQAVVDAPPGLSLRDVE